MFKRQEILNRKVINLNIKCSVSIYSSSSLTILCPDLMLVLPSHYLNLCTSL